MAGSPFESGREHVDITVGRIVHYTLSDTDAQQIAARRNGIDRMGNPVAGGQVYPAVAVRVFTPGTVANLQVLLDGTDTFWATSRPEGDTPGTWTWPPRS